MIEEASEYGGSTIQTTVNPTLKDFNKVLQLVDTQKYLETLKHILKQEIQNKDNPKIWYTPAGMKPLMNDYGIMKMGGWLQSLMDKTISQGNLSETKTYNRVMRDILNAINDDLFDNDDEYSLSDEDKNYVYHMMKAAIEIYLTRLISDRERKYIYSDDGSKMHKTESYYRPKRRNDRESVYEG